MGELYRAMVELDERARDDPLPLWVHVPNRDLHEIVRRFGVRGLDAPRPVAPAALRLRGRKSCGARAAGGARRS
jgi:hypothetical protein